MVRRAHRALARRAFADARTRNISFGLLFLIVAVLQPAAYRQTYPTLADRMAFAESFGTNRSVMLFYGKPRDLLTVEGYTAWRVGGILALFAAVWGVMAAVRALRAEEDAGRQELVLAAAVGRRQAFLSALAGVAGGIVVLWLAILAGLVMGGLAVPGSAFLALVTVSPAVVFAAAGAAVCQLADSRRLATALGLGLVSVAFVVRVVADTDDRPALRWASPLGWTEEMRAFADPRPAVLLLPAVLAALLVAVAAAALARRDIGRGMLSSRDARAPRTRLLGSAPGQALRAEAGVLAAWAAGLWIFALVIGVVSSSISAAGISEELRRQLEAFGGLSIVTPRGYLSLTFLFFVLAVCLFACAQVTAARHEEADGRLETLLALPLGRARWLAGRLALAVAAAAMLGLGSGVAAWAGAASQSAGVGLAGMLAAGANCVPAAVLFLGIAALGFAVLPRSSATIAYGAVSAAFVWELFGAVAGAPDWTLQVSPFHHIGFVPAQSFRPLAAAVMAAVGLAAAGAALWRFRRRDLVGA
ncbi:MAG: polyketide antibiotic transporter [Thermoleophilia bacterium]|nr:polyketide antibiotic transporter [Thermoleophilia bacterium]